MGYTVDVDPFRVPSDPTRVVAILIALAALAAVVGVALPAPAAVAAALFVALAHAEMLGFPIVGHAFATKATENVWARMPGSGPVARTIVLVAHLDAPRALPSWWPRSKTSLRLVTAVVGVAALAVPAFLVLATFPGFEEVRFAAAPFGAVLAVAAGALALAGNGAPTMGANDDAAGVAAVLAAAGQHAAEPLAESHLEVLLTGGATVGPWGMRRFSKRFRRHYLADRTYVLEVDRVARGTFTSLETDGLMVTTRGDREILAALAQAAGRHGLKLAKGGLPLARDGHAARLRGWKAATLTATDPTTGDALDVAHADDVLARVDPLHVEAAARLVIATTRALDEARGRREGDDAR